MIRAGRFSDLPCGETESRPVTGLSPRHTERGCYSGGWDSTPKPPCCFPSRGLFIGNPFRGDWKINRRIDFQHELSECGTFVPVFKVQTVFDVSKFVTFNAIALTRMHLRHFLSVNFAAGFQNDTGGFLAETQEHME